jgi:hypothetical protein
MGNIIPIDSDTPGSWFYLTGNNIDQGGFPGSIWADQADNFAVFYVQIYVV